MRSGADSEMTSGLGGAEVDIIKQAPGHPARRADARSPRPSSTSIIDLPKKSHQHRRPTCRCAASSRRRWPVRDEVSIVEGRMFEFGTNEVVVGRGASGQFAGLDASATTITSGQNTLEGRRHLRGRRRRRRDRDLVRRAGAAGRLPPRQHLSDRCWRGSTRPTASTRSATG